MSGEIGEPRIDDDYRMLLQGFGNGEPVIKAKAVESTDNEDVAPDPKGTAEMVTLTNYIKARTGKAGVGSLENPRYWKEL